MSRRGSPAPAGRRWLSLALPALLLAALVLAPQPVHAAEGDVIHSIDISVQLFEDGSAQFTELWDVSIYNADSTEWYIAKHNLDNMEISGLTVVDENGLFFEDTGAWEVEASRDEKAYKSGLLEAEGGYELCWGFGEPGRHTYTITYHMTGLVKGYEGSDAITYWFISNGTTLPVDDVTIVLWREDVDFVVETTGIWVVGLSADYGFEDGMLWVQSDRTMEPRQGAGILTEFAEGMFQPADVRERSFEDVREEGLAGSDYGGEESLWDEIKIPIIGGGSVVAFVALMLFLGRNPLPKREQADNMLDDYKAAGYCRSLPYGGSLPASYSRLSLLSQKGLDGNMIGAHLLRWLRLRQVDVLKPAGGGCALQMYGPRPGMMPLEKALYDMLLAAAGPEYMLEASEFQDWSKENYEKVKDWLKLYKENGMQQLESLGCMETFEVKRAFGLLTTTWHRQPEAGLEKTVELFGFKKYLEDFTIINEREAREVQLWDEYLVFAQVFGIAEAVAEQFKALYPDYFTSMDKGRDSGINMYEAIALNHITQDYGRAMYEGYRAGYSASRDDGGGGHSSSGGGGGFSGGGGGSGSR